MKCTQRHRFAVTLMLTGGAIVLAALVCLIGVVLSEGVTAEQSRSEALSHHLVLVPGTEPMADGDDMGVQVDMGSTKCTTVFYGSEQGRTRINVWLKQDVQTQPFIRVYNPASANAVLTDSMVSLLCK